MDDLTRSGSWAQAQHQFRDRLQRGALSETPAPVLWRWWTTGTAEVADGVLGVLGPTDHGADRPRQRIALYRPDAVTGARPILVFDAAAPWLSEACGGPERGHVLGAIAPDGCLVLQTDGGAIWPVVPPIDTGWRLPKL